MQQFNNPANVRPTGLLGPMPSMQPQTLTTPIGSISDQERMNIMQMQRSLANEGLKAFPGAISDQERMNIMQMQQMQLPQPMQSQPMGLLGRY